MNAMTHVALRHPVAEIEVTAAWPVVPGALLLIGRAERPLPCEGVAQLERRRADRGPFRLLAWRGEQGGGFVAAVRLPPGTDLLPGQRLMLPFGEAEPITARLPARFATQAEFGREALERAAGHGAELAGFLCDAFPSAALKRLPQARTLVTTVLKAVAETDGFVEMMGAVPEACAFLQGWGRVVDGPATALLVGTEIVHAALHTATFARPDIAGPAVGLMMVLPPAAADAFDDFEAVYVVGKRVVLRRPIAQRRRLDATDSHGHIRDMLPTLRCSSATADGLRRALRPRYEGHDTLSGGTHPTRAAVDLALLTPGAGVYLCGWVFDPACHIAAVHLRGLAGASLRLDERWVRVARADVTGAFAGEAGFAKPRSHAHGFAVSWPVANGQQSDRLYLEFEFHDGTCGFLPVATCDTAEARGRALAITDLHQASGLSVVERHLAPYFAWRGRLARPPVIAVPHQGSALHTQAIVVPLSGAPALPRAFLAQFLDQPLSAQEQLVFVCGPEWEGMPRDALRRLLDFHELAVQIIDTLGLVTATAALDLAMAETMAADFLLAAPTVTGAMPAWRPALRLAVASQTGPTVACPTMLYEDHSVRFAGNTACVPVPTAPYVNVQHRLAGLHSAGLPDWPPQPSELVSLTCCLIPRAVLRLVGGASQGMATVFGEETALSLRLRSADVACLWVPQARVYAPDASGAPDNEVGRLVDGWCLRETLAAAA